METVMEAWPMPDLQRQVDAIREAFSADIRRPFVLKPSFPYGSPHMSSPSSSPRTNFAYQGGSVRGTSSMNHLDPSNEHVSYITHPITPPVSLGPMDSRSDSPAVQSLGMMSRNGQAPNMQSSMALGNNPPTWNPARIFEYVDVLDRTKRAIANNTLTGIGILHLVRLLNLALYPTSLHRSC